MLKNVQSTAQLHWFHMPARSCSKSFKLGLSNWTELRLQQYMNQELPDVEVGFRNCRGTRVQLLTSTGISKKQSDSIQPWYTPSPILNQSIVPCLVLTVASWLAYRFLRRQVRCSGILISWRIFHSLFWSTQSETLAYSMKHMFFWSSLFFYPTDFGSLISVPTAFSKSSLNILKLLVHVLLLMWWKVKCYMEL